MVHKKEVHTEKVAVCWNFVEGHCDFGDKLCWFNHTIDTSMTAVVFNCNLCVKVFKTRSSSQEEGAWTGSTEMQERKQCNLHIWK